MPNAGRRRSRSRNRAGWFGRVFRNGGRTATSPHGKPEAPIQVASVSPQELIFECQLAHGSQTVKIPAVGGHREMYKAIARAFKLDVEEILYCTVNTYKLEMDKLLTSTIPLHSIIFAHLRGQKKQVTLEKSDELLGVTITDNFGGHCIVKRVREDSVCGRASPAIQIGDHIESVNGESVVGKRHFQVAHLLRSIPTGHNITLRLISPLTSGFSFIGQRAAVLPQQLNSESGNQTIRFFANGEAAIEEEAPDQELIAKINAIFDEYLGLHDDDLALSIWELGRDSADLLEMRDRLRQSAELAPFALPDELIFDMWGVVSDQKAKN